MAGKTMDLSELEEALEEGGGGGQGGTRELGAIYDIPVQVQAVLGKATMQVTLDGCIDGTSFARTMKGPMSLEMRGSAEANGMQFTVAMDMTGTEEEVVEDVSKK